MREAPLQAEPNLICSATVNAERVASASSGCNRDGRLLISHPHESNDDHQGHAFGVGRCSIFGLRSNSNLKKCEAGPSSRDDNARRRFPDGKRSKARSASGTLPESGNCLPGLVGIKSKSERFERSSPVQLCSRPFGLPSSGDGKNGAGWGGDDWDRSAVL